VPSVRGEPSLQQKQPQRALKGGQAMKMIGVVLIVVGVFMLIYQGITYTKRKTVADIGPLTVQTEQNKTIPLPPIVGGLTLAGGIALVLAGKNR